MKRVVKMPFRLDLVMGGVSDLDFWSDMPGDCLSLSCHIEKKAIQVEGELLDSSDCVFKGFSIKNLTIDNLLINNGDINIVEVPYEIQMGVAALITAFEVLKNHNISYKKGILLNNCSVRQKGMGGSSALAATIIALTCKLVGNVNLDFSDLINAVLKAEHLCGSNGGWEDVAGAYYSGINYVKYRPSEKEKLSVKMIDCSDLDFLQENLLLVDSGISASTAEILSVAQMRFETFKETVVVSANNIRHECNKVLDALYAGDVKTLGESLIRQRENWGAITGGTATCAEISRIMASVSENIHGFREAGAGGGGTVLVICKEQKKNAVINSLQKNGFRILPWCKSEYGLEFC